MQRQLDESLSVDNYQTNQSLATPRCVHTVSVHTVPLRTVSVHDVYVHTVHTPHCVCAYCVCAHCAFAHLHCTALAFLAVSLPVCRSAMHIAFRRTFDNSRTDRTKYSHLRLHSKSLTLNGKRQQWHRHCIFYNLHIQEVSGVDTISERFADAAKKHIVEVVEVDWWHHGTHCKSCWCSRRSSRWSSHGADVQVVDVDGTMQSRSLWEAMRAKSGIKPSVLSSLPTGITWLLTNNDNWLIQYNLINEMEKQWKNSDA